jgi:hypothetical protein
MVIEMGENGDNLGGPIIFKETHMESHGVQKHSVESLDLSPSVKRLEISHWKGVLSLH